MFDRVGDEVVREANTGVNDVAGEISKAIDKASKARDALAQADDLAEDAHDLLAVALRGSVADQSNVEQMLDGFREARADMLTLLRTLDAGRAAAERYLATLTVEGTPRPGPVTQRPAQPPRQPPPDRAAGPDETLVVPPEQLEALRRELPPPITRVSSGQKTHGRWIRPDGTVEPIVSGRDADADSADERLEKLDMPGRAARAADVEMKLAARMVREGIRHATVVINYTPCRGRFGCDTLVPIVLPEGATLTVHGVTPEGQPFRKRYTGGARPWWR
ncbi:hypothetical protein FHS29_001306 [Saccharothrix tamanrassetensis]|uniref:Nucleic acid/nucleotide deaminase of polymorphic system toxin n=1 Tax=Saccharothrix tamanrassetensis TaxID=1051531 RepID=A0A841CGA5_9PSEU|nr:DddA-like double-stranded DNA deaminase toxin [Saccharothrix tamanrassetensis]MBB5954736.1 hypothetical protein [Saccharothrix tamanrassetensis]